MARPAAGDKSRGDVALRGKGDRRPIGVRRGVPGVAGVLLLLLAWAAVPGAAQVPPDEDWRSLDTEHFRVTFPARLEALGRRTGAVAESARERLAGALLAPPDHRVELILTDHVDASNGLADVTPYNRIIVYARPPVDGFALSHFEDWLELVVVHELAHVVHLDVAGGAGRVLRSVFGRVPSPWLFFPELASPRWVVEGLATWYESRLTGMGRVQGTYFESLLRAAALDGTLERVDEASGDSPAWPSGQRPYAYGSLFFAWLLERHGEERMADFVEAVGSQWIPYRLNAAARSAFGVSFSDAWEVWRSETVERARALADSAAARAPRAAPERVTRDARLGFYARVGPGGVLAYARADGRDDSGLRFRPVGAGPRDGDVREVRTNGLATFDWLGDGSVVFSQLQLAGPWRARGDLYVLEPGGRIRRLTRGARLEDPSAAPDGRAVWATRTLPGTTDLVRVHLEDGRVETLPALPAGLHWAFPAVSPDGRRVAAVRWAPGEGADLVLLDAADGRVVRRLTHDRALELAPAWAPDGTLVWTSDRTGVPNLYAAAPDGAGGEPGAVRQVTDVATAIGFPSVDPGGRWIHASLLGGRGWDVVRLPFDPAAWVEPRPVDPRFREGEAAVPATGGVAGTGTAEEAGRVRSYSPWSTLRPRYWEPVVVPEVASGGRTVLGTFVGFATGGEDAVGRHAFDLRGALSTSGGALDARASWVWRGLGNPLLGVTVQQGWDAARAFGRRSTDALDTLYVEERERAAFLDLTLLHSRWRRSSAATLSTGLVWEDRTLLDRNLREQDVYRLRRPSSRLADVRLSLSTSTVRRHELSPGPDAGWSAFVRLRKRHELDVADSLRTLLGGDRGVNEVIGRVKAYRSLGGPGFADHVLAVQAAGGAANGSGADQAHFEVGGTPGTAEPLTGLALFGGSSYFFPVRGYPEGQRAGRWAWAAGVEWRFPLALVNHGLGLFPLHLDRLHGAVFVDAGNAWGPELGQAGYQQPRLDPLVSLGAEARVGLLALFSVPVEVRIGLAGRLVAPTGTSAYVRLGSAF